MKTVLASCAHFNPVKVDGIIGVQMEIHALQKEIGIQASGGGSGGGRSTGGPAPTSSMSTIRGAFGTMIIGGNANAGGASGGSGGGSGGGFKSAFSSMIDKLREKAAPSKSSAASREPSTSLSGGGGVGGFAGKISSGVSAFLAPPPPS